MFLHGTYLPISPGTGPGSIPMQCEYTIIKHNVPYDPNMTPPTRSIVRALNLWHCQGKPLVNFKIMTQKYFYRNVTIVVPSEIFRILGGYHCAPGVVSSTGGTHGRTGARTRPCHRPTQTVQRLQGVRLCRWTRHRSTTFIFGTFYRII